MTTWPKQQAKVPFHNLSVIVRARPYSLPSQEMTVALTRVDVVPPLKERAYVETALASGEVATGLENNG